MTTFFKYKAGGGFTKSKGPKCKYEARRQFKEKVAKMKSGALELVDSSGNKLEEFAAPDAWADFCDAAAENAYWLLCRRHEGEGLPVPPTPEWRKSFF